jgi:hypothetical protein
MRARLAVGVRSEIRGDDHEAEHRGDIESPGTRARNIGEARVLGCRQTPSIDHPHRLIEASITALRPNIVKKIDLI